MTDWETWPLFTLQLLTLVLFVLPKDKKIFGVLPKSYILLALIAICFAIAVSLYYDSTDPLHLYF